MSGVIFLPDGGLKSWEILESLVVTACEKLLFQELQLWPTLTPGDLSSSTFVPQEGCKHIKVVSEPFHPGHS